MNLLKVQVDFPDVYLYQYPIVSNVLVSMLSLLLQALSYAYVSTESYCCAPVKFSESMHVCLCECV